MLVFNLLYLFAARPFPPQEQTFLLNVLVSPANVCLIYHIKEKPRICFTFTFYNKIFTFLFKFLILLTFLQFSCPVGIWNLDILQVCKSKRYQEKINLSLFIFHLYSSSVLFFFTLYEFCK